MLVVNKVGLVTVDPLTHDVGQVAQGKDVGMPVELCAVLQIKASAGTYLFKYKAKSGLLNMGIHVGVHVVFYSSTQGCAEIGRATTPVPETKSAKSIPTLTPTQTEQAAVKATAPSQGLLQGIAKTRSIKEKAKFFPAAGVT